MAFKVAIYTDVVSSIVLYNTIYIQSIIYSITSENDKKGPVTSSKVAKIIDIIFSKFWGLIAKFNLDFHPVYFLGEFFASKWSENVKQEQISSAHNYFSNKVHALCL